jgi:hypothetical protein
MKAIGDPDSKVLDARVESLKLKELFTTRNWRFAFVPVLYFLFPT